MNCEKLLQCLVVEGSNQACLVLLKAGMYRHEQGVGQIVPTPVLHILLQAPLLWRSIPSALSPSQYFHPGKLNTYQRLQYFDVKYLLQLIQLKVISRKKKAL